MAKRVTLGRRSAVVTVLFWGLVIVGIIIFLAALIIGLVFVGRKDPVFAHFLYWWLLSFHYVAWGYNFAMLFGTVLLKRAGGFLEQALILAILYLLALIFDILAGIFYGIIGFEACAGKNQDQVEAGICDNEQWIVWVLWILIIILIIHAAVGVIAAVLDRFMRRSPSGGEESLGEPAVQGVDIEGRRFSSQAPTAIFSSAPVPPSQHLPTPATVVYASAAPPANARHVILAPANQRNGTADYTYAYKSERKHD